MLNDRAGKGRAGLTNQLGVVLAGWVIAVLKMAAQSTVALLLAFYFDSKIKTGNASSQLSLRLLPVSNDAVAQQVFSREDRTITNSTTIALLAEW